MTTEKKVVTSNIEIQLINSKFRSVDVVSFVTVNIANEAKSEVVSKSSVVKSVKRCGLLED